MNLSKTDQAESIVDECYNEYFSSESLSNAKENSDWTCYNLGLRLRDFASVVEADRAMRQGDIGCVVLMWKRWSIMAQGIVGLSHYGLHLPRLILLLEEDLPKPLAHAIKHSMLIPASGRAGHFIAKDFFLEIQNYWLKYFYNHSVGFLFCNRTFTHHTIESVRFLHFQGEGTDIRRLTNCYSVNIPLVSLLYQRKYSE